MNWLAGTDPVGGIDLSPFLQFGIVGVLAALGILFAWRAYLREVQRADDLAAENRRLNTAIQEKFIPALTESTTLMHDVAELLRVWRSPPGRGG